MRLKRFRQFIKEMLDLSGEPKIYKTAYTTIPEVAKRFTTKEARFIITHEDKLRFGEASQLIHLQLAIEDPTYNWMSMTPNQMDRAFSKSAKYAGYISLKDKTFSIAEIDSSGMGYSHIGRKKLSAKAQSVIEFLEKKGFQRLRDGDWPR